MTWIFTYSGKKIDFANPDPSQISIEDIARSLSRLPRFVAHTSDPVPYSVGQHSFLMSQQYEGLMALHMLLHDASEAYTNDVPRPLKQMLSGFKEVESRLKFAIYVSLGIFLMSGAEYDQVAWADARMLRTELEQLTQNGIKGTIHEFNEGLPVGYGIRIIPCHHDYVQSLFMERFEELMNDVKERS